MKKFLVAALVLFCTAASALAQTSVTLPIAANAVADIGNGPIKVRVIAGNASIFTAQGSGTGSTSGSSTALTLTATPTTAPKIGGLISGIGITSGTTVAAYDGTTGITLSAAMTVSSAVVSWGASCPASAAGIPSQYIQASVMADYYLLYTQARVCAVSPGGPVNTLLILPIFYDQTSATAVSSVFGRTGAVVAASSDYSIGQIAGLGTGVATALGINVGSAGAPVVNGGALGTPSSGTLTSATGLPVSTGLAGAGTGVLTALGVNVGSAGAFVIFNGAGGTPASLVGTNITGTASGLTAGVASAVALGGITGLGTGVATALGNTAGGAGGFALVGTTPPTGSAGGDLTGTYPNPTLAAVIAAGGPTGSATAAPIITYDAKGRLTAVSSATVTPAVGSITGLGTGVAAALAVNTGTAGSHVVNGGALGTPSSGTATNLTGLPIAGLTGLGTGVATALAVNVGSAGAFVTFNGALGTPSSGTATNLTGLPVSTGITGLGTGVATALGNTAGGSSGFVKFDAKSHIGITQTSPAPSFCGTSPSVVGTDTAGEVTTGSPNDGGQCVITFANSGYTSAPSCTVTQQSGVAPVYVISTTAITVNANAGVGTKIDWSCFGA